MVKRILALAVIVALPVVATAAGPGVPLESAGVDVSNQASLQRGAKYFVNYCLGRHSMEYVRYNRLGDDLGLSEDQLIRNIM
jgi:ubiquinol-cytochrome c reductase cytochrome c1 subunit